MSLSLRRVADVRNVGASYAATYLIYTVPTGKKTLLRTVSLSADNGSTNFRMGVTIDGAGYLWDNVLRDQYDSKLYAVNTLLTAGQQLHLGTDVSGSYAMVQGVEMDAAENPTLHRVTFLSVTTAQTYVIPTGKRFRIREIAACPHNVTTPFNLFIGSQGYVLRRTLLASRPQILEVDLCADAGETLGVDAQAGAVLHVWLTGTLEDL